MKRVGYSISLSTIITIIIFVCMIIPFLFTSPYFYAQLRNNTYKKMKNDLNILANESFSTIDSNLLSVNNIYYTIISDPVITPRLYNNLSSSAYDNISPDTIDERLTKIMFFCTIWNEKILSSVALFKSIDSYHYIDNVQMGENVDSTSLNAINGITTRWDKLSKYIENNKRINLFFHASGNSRSLFYIRDYYDYTNGTFDGLLSFELNEDKLLESFEVFNQYKGSLCILYNKDHNIIASNSNQIKSTSLEDAVYNGMPIKKMINDNDNYLVEAHTMSNFDLSAVILVPLQPIHKQLFNQLRNYVYIFIALFFGVILIALLISRFINQYINLMLKQISSIQEGEYSLTVAQYGIREIDNLNTAFYDMSSQIKYLLQEKYASEVLLKESELKALQAQMNPHFLFNTLLSISWKARANGDNECYEMISALSNLLNSNIYTKETKYIPIREEIQNVKYYLTIQMARFGERLSYDIDIASELWDLPILKLSIQPIVENAVVHGLENSIKNGYILVEGKIVDSTIEIKIIDNGIGIDPDRLDNDMILPAPMEGLNKSTNNHHIGLFNTHLRLKYTYGEPYGLTIKSIKGKGTTVTVTYPMERGV